MGGRGGVGGRGAYAELHCHSNFSFLDGASHPHELVEEATRLGLEALALTDHDGMYGAVRFAEAARATGLSSVFGAELTLGLASSRPEGRGTDGTHLVVLARDPTGYARLCKALSAAHLLGGQKGCPRMDLPLLAALGSGAALDLSGVSMPAQLAGSPLPTLALHGTADHWAVLTGCRKGAVPSALVRQGPAAATSQLNALQRYLGRSNVFVEIWDHGEPLASARNDALVELACRSGADVVATNNVHYHQPARGRLAAAMAAVRGRRNLDDMDGWLPAYASAHLRSAAEQSVRFARYPGATATAAQLGAACAFDLALVSPKLPPYPTPPGHDEMTWLRHLTEQGARKRYGPRDAPAHPRAYAQIDYELDIVDKLGFAGYFLVVWDIVRFCNEAGIYCQGRGSAANSAVCYALGVTKADAVSLGLLFERFLSPERDGPPDIDIDIESDRREEAIQYVYRRYGRSQAAQVANVITYRPRSAVRDMAKALGAPQGQVDALSKCIDPWGPLPPVTSTANQAGTGPVAPAEAGATVPGPVLDLARQISDFPRHMGIHSGGMVLCDRPVAEVCPVEWARMADRSVLQWDKDDCARAGLVKFDMLGLGMLSALHATVDHIRDFYSTEIDLATIPQEPAVYEMLCNADTVGVFQVESRAQMATLPRLRPRTFYDLVIEVALIRPGPIQGRSVHPYLRRRQGTEAVTYLHPLLEPSLAKTLGVPLFQEQLMQMAIDVAGFSPAEADQLRQAMGAKRSAERMARLRERFYAGAGARGATGRVAELIWQQMSAFANFGFPESHAVSFAYLVYSSAWLKLHYPAAFLAGLLDNQPMGFWSPQSLVMDARRHGVEVMRPDVNSSKATSKLEARAGDGDVDSRAGGTSAVGETSAVGKTSRQAPAVRLGLGYIRNIGARLAANIATGQPYDSLEDLVRRCGLTAPQVEALATAGALGCLGSGRREALWAAGAIARDARRPAELPGLEGAAKAPSLPAMSPLDLNQADLWATGVSPGGHPVEFYREYLDRLSVLSAAQVLAAVKSGRLHNGAAVAVGGAVTHRQRPATANGVVFMNLEDETGLVNVICPRAFWQRYGQLARTSAAVVVRGKLESADGVVNVLALEVEALPLPGAAQLLPSRDFR